MLRSVARIRLMKTGSPSARATVNREVCRSATALCCLYLSVTKRDYRSRDSVVGMATSYVLDDLGVGVRVPVGSRIFSSPYRTDWL
jgi:hypothetical protein